MMPVVGRPMLGGPGGGRAWWARRVGTKRVGAPPVRCSRVDRMAGARFELPESAIESRKGIRLHIEEVDSAVVEIGEKK